MIIPIQRIKHKLFYTTKRVFDMYNLIVSNISNQEGQYTYNINIMIEGVMTDGEITEKTEG